MKYRILEFMRWVLGIKEPIYTPLSTYEKTTKRVFRIQHKCTVVQFDDYALKEEKRELLDELTSYIDCEWVGSNEQGHDIYILKIDVIGKS